MLMFSERFSSKKSFEIDYKGKKVNAFYKFDKQGMHILRFTFIESKSTFKQAIIFHFNQFIGEIVINDKKIDIPKRQFFQLIFEETETSAQFDVHVELKAGDIVICNGSDPLGYGGIWHSLSHGCAMIIESIKENHFKFYCNDHENDDDFDDLIFELEIFEVR